MTLYRPGKALYAAARCALAPLLFGALSLAGCGAERGDGAESAEVEAAPSPLSELLYAGEGGPRARQLGDSVRIRIWLRQMELSPEQLAHLQSASRRIQERSAALQETLSALDLSQRERLGPLYQEMARALEEGEPSAEVMSAWAARLRELRALDPDPRRLRQQWADALLAEADAFLGTLSAGQTEKIGEALFFLRSSVGPDTDPTTWDALVGDPWPPGDFATLRRSASPEAPEPLDLAALWTLDAGETELLAHLGPGGRQAVLALALTHPEMESACAALTGPPAP